MQHSIFENVRFLNELGVISSTLISIGLLSATAGVMHLIDKAQEKIKKNKPESAKAIQEKLRKAEEENEKRRKDDEKFIQDVKKVYGIDLNVLDDNIDFKSQEEVFNSMIKDGKQWLSKILNSKIFAESVNELLNNKEKLDWILSEYNYPKPTLNFFKNLFKPKKGINGIESIEVLETQAEAFEFCWVLDDMARMYNIRYERYLNTKCDTGDGDEGHIYYSLINID